MITSPRYDNTFDRWVARQEGRLISEDDLSTIIGLTPVKIEKDIGEDFFRIHFSNNSVLRMYHAQDCCESVGLEDMEGDFNDLLGHPILVAEERVSTDEPPKDEYSESYTWTFYTFRSIGGSVDLRFLGESNGYYSESVNTIHIMKVAQPKFVSDNKYKDLFQ